MILTHDKILEEIKNGNIKIEPLSEDLIGPASVDLHLGNLFRRFKHHNEVFAVVEEANFEESLNWLRQKTEALLCLNRVRRCSGLPKKKLPSH